MRSSSGGYPLAPDYHDLSGIDLRMVPLLIAIGPGAESRFAIGLTISAGLGIGTLFTVFVLPAFYILLARDHHGSAADEYGNDEESSQVPAGNH